MISTETNRTGDAVRLVEDLNLRQDAEFFAIPENRIEFIESLTSDDFRDLTKHINDRVRGFEPRDRARMRDTGGALLLMATPSPEEKPAALRAGFETIQDYLATSDDSVEQKVKGAGMAMEALVIWVHPFDDGNGRTSRFLGKFLEDGTVDIDQLIAETAERNNRLRVYYDSLRIDKGNMVKDTGIILNDEEIAEYRKTEMPIADGISLSIKQLLEDKALQETVDAKQEQLKSTLVAFQEKIAT